MAFRVEIAQAPPGAAGAHPGQRAGNPAKLVDASA